jgi:putative ABC transport system substrate-binding protein
MASLGTSTILGNRIVPGGNVTGFTNMEYGMSGKYLELLKEIAPRMARAAFCAAANRC